MKTLLRRMAFEGFRVRCEMGEGDSETELVADLWRDIRDAVAFDVTPVHIMEQAAAAPAGELQEPVGFGDAVRMPYPKCWFEYRGDKLAVAVSTGVGADPTNAERCTQAGVLATEIADGTEIECYIFVASPHTPPRVLGGLRFGLDEQGGIQGTTGQLSMRKWASAGRPKGLPEHIDEEWFALSSLICPAVHAVKLLNCQNVVKDWNYDWTVEKRAAFKMGVPAGKVVRYHTLSLKLPRGQRRSFASMVADEQHFGLHSVRGHFKRYTDAAPLLGRFTGTWWWHPFMRGDNAYGEIVKDYTVSPSPDPRTTCLA